MIIYMYEEWFEKLAKSLEIVNVVDNNKLVQIKLPVNISQKIDGQELFLESYRINKNFSLDYKNGQINIMLDKNKLEKHYLMYLIGILIKIREMTNK